MYVTKSQGFVIYIYFISRSLCYIESFNRLFVLRLFCPRFKKCIHRALAGLRGAYAARPPFSPPLKEKNVGILYQTTRIPVILKRFSHIYRFFLPKNVRLAPLGGFHTIFGIYAQILHPTLQGSMKYI